MNGFSDLELNYYKTQINGTILVTTRQTLSRAQLLALEAGAGELFLARIQKIITPEDIMEVVTELGDVYKLRFKIDLSGGSRGYAYLQYIDERNMERALMELALRFRVAKINIKVCQSRNKRELLLRKVPHLTPLQVYEELRRICPYVKLRCYEYEPQNYVYIIEYRNNDDATLAHQMLRTKRDAFGANAIINWMSNICPRKCIAAGACCVQLTRCSPVHHQLLQMAEHRCFKF